MKAFSRIVENPARPIGKVELFGSLIPATGVSLAPCYEADCIQTTGQFKETRTSPGKYASIIFMQ